MKIAPGNFKYKTSVGCVCLTRIHLVIVVRLVHVQHKKHHRSSKEREHHKSSKRKQVVSESVEEEEEEESDDDKHKKNKSRLVSLLAVFRGSYVCCKQFSSRPKDNPVFYIRFNI